MKVDVIYATANPLDVIAIAAGTSTGHMNPDHRRVRRCYESGHMSVFEHASVTLAVTGISRACSHQLVRHRMASFVQLSQRYTRLDGDDWYVMPPALAEADKGGTFELQFLLARHCYEDALKAGVKPEDARFLLPEATKTDITMTVNVRELFHFLDLRCDSHAQWEIRDLANAIRDEVDGINDQWHELMSLWEVTK